MQNIQYIFDKFRQRLNKRSDVVDETAHCEQSEHEDDEAAPRFMSNGELIDAAVEHLVKHAETESGTLPLVVGCPQLDETILSGLRERQRWAQIEGVTLQINPGQLPIGIGGKAQPLVLVLKCAFYGLDRRACRSLLAALPRETVSVAIVDQTDNCNGDASRMLSLKDSEGRPYEAECHDFRNLLIEAGYGSVLALPCPDPSKSLSGVVLASRSGRPIAETFREDWAEQKSRKSGSFGLVPPFAERVARLQRPGDSSYLDTYWNCHAAERFSRAVAAIDADMEARAATADGGAPVRFFDFGCASGAVFRAITNRFADRFPLELFGVDPDARAVRHLRQKLPDAVVFQADDIRLRCMGFADTAKVDCCSAFAVLLLLDEDRVQGLIEDFARMSDLIIIGDQIENLEGDATTVLDLVDFEDKPYQAVCHPFARMLRGCGFGEIESIPFEDHVKGATGLIVARRPASEVADEDRIEPQLEAYIRRTRKFQRPDDPSYLQTYWEVFDRARFMDVCAVVRELAPCAAANGGAVPSDSAEPDNMVRIFDFGCSAGPLFRSLQAYLGDQMQFEFAGADVDRQAIEFVRRNVDGVVAFDADPQRLAGLGIAETEHFDFCCATSLFYALGDAEANLLLGEMAKMTDTLVIGDQIENFEGTAAQTLNLVSSDGVAYDSYCHPFKVMLQSLGFDDFAVFDALDLVKSRTGMIVARRHKPLPPQFQRNVRERARCRYFGPMPDGIGRVASHPLRGAYDTSALQVECLPSNIPIVKGEIRGGPELIGTAGVKLAAEIPPGSDVCFEIEDQCERITSEIFSWEREPIDHLHQEFTPDKLYPRQSVPQETHSDLWGSWADLSTSGGIMICHLDEQRDIDANQADGIGPLDLMFYTFPKPDLRDAVLELEIRGRDFDPGDADVMILMQNNIEANTVPGALVRENLACSKVMSDYILASCPLTPHLLSGDWRSLSIPLPNKAEDWSFAGNVLADREGGARFSYIDLDSTLGNVFNIHILACFPRDVPNIENKRDVSRYGRRPHGFVEVRQAHLRRPGEGTHPRFACTDYLMKPNSRGGRYRVHTACTGDEPNIGPWHSFEVPREPVPVVIRLTHEKTSGAITGRINAMGYRTWCWLDDGSTRSERLYLGTTKHGRDFRYRPARAKLVAKARLVIANEHGGVAFPLSEI